MKTNWSDYEMYMKPVHLKGQAVTLTIVKATEEETHPQRGKSVMSPVLWFREMPFGLILSPTNRATLLALYGDRVQDCLGKPIVVKAVKERVAGRDKEPIRIQPTRPNAPRIEPTTGEIVTPPESETEPATTVVYSEAHERVLTEALAGQSEPPASELDAFLGPRATAGAEVKWPTTEAEFNAWTKERKINGAETRNALGTDAKAWMRMNGKVWADVAQTIAATLAK